MQVRLHLFSGSTPKLPSKGGVPFSGGKTQFVTASTHMEKPGRQCSVVDGRIIPEAGQGSDVAAWLCRSLQVQLEALGPQSTAKALGQG